MLQREYRLSLQKRSTPLRSYKTPFVVIKVFTTESSVPQFGFIVSKSVAKHATTRNRVKRQVRSLVEQELHQFTKGYAILFIVQKGALGASTEQLEKIILPALKKLSVLS